MHVAGARILVLGLAFKENCPDIRNTKVIDIVNELKDYGAKVDCFDPWVSSTEAKCEFGIMTSINPEEGAFDAIILAVAHKQFVDMGENQVRAFGKKVHILYDLKYVLPKSASDLRL